ncbi:CWF19-like protein 2 homolog [Drosophila nasuta]|uniref:CWF19-like protein 2 homolog n=1 Tax=Drosophila nasuta TaxID=42062 RepID=UPI00295E6774|nr:CWF19-like protein 2 homolog [Drosophila nasuta]
METMKRTLKELAKAESEHGQDSKRSSAKKQKKHKRKSKSKRGYDDSDSSSSSGNEKKRKKQRKKSKKRRKQSSSSSSYDSDSDTSDSSDWVEAPAPKDSSDDSSDEKSSKRHHKKSKKRKTKKRRKQSENSTDEEQEKEKKPDLEQKTTLQRDNWMTNNDAPFSLRTFEKQRKEPRKPNAEHQQNTYDPATSRYELNPYWQRNGTGLPGFQKPANDDDQRTERQREEQRRNPAPKWQKAGTATAAVDIHRKEQVEQQEEQQQDEQQEQEQELLTDEQLNALAARALKAELKQKVELAAQLNQQLAKARKLREEDAAKPKSKSKNRAEEKHVLLTRSDASGNVRPLLQSSASTSTSASNSGGNRKQNKKRMETHVDGERVRYFADDDRYDIKQMFEREKYATAADSNLEYAEMLAKHKNPNDDLEDIFNDNARKSQPQGKSEQRELHRAVHEHEKLAATMSNCQHCLGSRNIDKTLNIALGDKLYLKLPRYEGLQEGHALITPYQHVVCAMQLDEDAWQEVQTMLKTMARLFAAQGKDVVFFEVANKLHKQQHMTIHCVPVAQAQGELVPFYFKKAIQESEEEWSTNRQLIPVKNQLLHKAIPKGLPYVWVNFGIGSGFAHIIEDPSRFPPTFALEVIGGMLNLNPNTWRRPRKAVYSDRKVKEYADLWSKHDASREDL